MFYILNLCILCWLISFRRVAWSFKEDMGTFTLPFHSGRGLLGCHVAVYTTLLWHLWWYFLARASYAIIRKECHDWTQKMGRGGEGGIGFRVRIDYSPQAKTLRDEMTRDKVGSWQFPVTREWSWVKKPLDYTLLCLILPFVLLGMVIFFPCNCNFFYFISLFTALSNYQVLSQQEVFFPRKGRKWESVIVPPL